MITALDVVTQPATNNGGPQKRRVGGVSHRLSTRYLCGLFLF
jgi:hypothetical protein